MSQELIYTSAPRGLRPGSKGFCTVAQTADLPNAWAERLESLSGYRAVFPLGDPSVGRNPVNWAHWRVNVGGKTRSVLSRVAFAGVDYSQRSNKFAHHLVLDAAEQSPAGPAWAMRQPGVMETGWAREPATLPAGRPVPRGDRAAQPCKAWQAATGDAGWAGVLAESFLADPNRPAYLIFSPGTDLLALIDEAIGLLPSDRRWQVTFSTYFTELPAGLSCAWRCVAAGTPAVKEAQAAGGRALTLNITHPLGQAADSPLVVAARNGAPPSAAEQARGSQVRPPYKLTPDVEMHPTKVVSEDAVAPRSRRRLAQNELDVLELVEDEPELADAPASWPQHRSPLPVRTPNSGGWIASCIGCLLLGLCAGYLLTTAISVRGVRKLSPTAVANQDPGLAAAKAILPSSASRPPEGAKPPGEAAQTTDHTPVTSATDPSDPRKDKPPPPAAPAQPAALDSMAKAPSSPSAGDTTQPMKIYPATDPSPALAVAKREVEALAPPGESRTETSARSIEFLPSTNVDRISLLFPNNRTDFNLGVGQHLSVVAVEKKDRAIAIRTTINLITGLGGKKLVDLATFEFDPQLGALRFHWTPINDRPKGSEDIYQYSWVVLQRSLVIGSKGGVRSAEISFHNDPKDGVLSPSKPFDLSFQALSLAAYVVPEFPTRLEPSNWTRSIVDNRHIAHYERPYDSEHKPGRVVAFDVKVTAGDLPGSSKERFQMSRFRLENTWNEDVLRQKYEAATHRADSAENEDEGIIDLKKRIDKERDDSKKKELQRAKDRRMAEIRADRDDWGQRLHTLEDLRQFVIPLRFENGVTVGTVTVPAPAKS